MLCCVLCAVLLHVLHAGVSSVANFIKSYQQRTGAPHEVQEKRS